MDVTVSHIRQVMSELKEFYTDETKVNKALENYAKQKPQIIQIKKSINSFLIKSFCKKI